MASRRKPQLIHLVLAACAVLFFIGSLSLAQSGRIYISPDESANSHFVRQLAHNRDFGSSDPLAVALGDRLHPRSMVSVNGVLLPVSFLGLPTLYAGIVRLTGSEALPFITPVIALLAIFAWRKTVEQLFSLRVANVTTVLLMFHPAFWYYTSRSLMHNVLFVSFVIFAACIWFHKPASKLIKRLSVHTDEFLVGLMLGLALFVRASEVYWVIGGLAFLWVWFRKKVSWAQVMRVLFGITIGIMPLLLMNFIAYGHPLVTGYTVETQVIAPAVSESLDATNIFPFGLHPKIALSNVASYGLGLFWWLSLLAFVGFIMCWKKHKAYLPLFVVVTAWHGLWYGSWTIFDNPDPSQISIANSYIRYWLPVFILSTPFIAKALINLSNHDGHKSHRTLLLVFSLIVLSLANMQATFVSGQDGLFHVANTLERSEEIRRGLYQTVELEDVVIVDRADKLFYPQQRLLYPLREESTYQLMPSIVEKTRLFYYGITFPEKDLTYLNERKLKEMGLQIELQETFDQESLYRIYAP